ncbi:MAG TPA: ATP-binding protein, partial [Kofleriaceae bacterium]|nr:ATP-binding protein [Kofleriaceae bacterium]
PGAPPAAGFLLDATVLDGDAAASRFATSYDVRCVLAVGATAPDQGLVVIAFCRAPVEPAAVRLLEVLAHHARVGWLGSDEQRALLGPGHGAAFADALDDLVGLQERLLVDGEAEHARSLERARADAQRTAHDATVNAERQAAHLHRAQRAMVNVIEDLREARESLAVTVDLRTRELATANRLLQARNRELEEFVYIASHDLQEPLRTVAGYLQLVQRRYAGALGLDADEFIGFAIDGAHRMQALIDSLLLYSRVATSDAELEAVPLDDAVDGAMRNLALRIEETSAAVLREAPLPTVHGDRVQLVQLFQNLLSNAIKFAGPRPPRVHLAGGVDGDRCTVTVRDEGIGFNPRFADRIFKIFRRLRRDTPGTGVGLAVCKKIVERHGGTIAADARPDEGATFTIELPAWRPQEAAP